MKMPVQHSPPTSTARGKKHKHSSSTSTPPSAKKDLKRAKADEVMDSLAK